MTAFPLSLTRTGGLAGFRDRLAITAEGRVTGTTGGGTVDCTVAASVAGALAAALDGPDASPRAGSDQMGVVLAGGGRQVSLGEATGGDAASTAAADLLDAVQRPMTAGAPCRAG